MGNEKFKPNLKRDVSENKGRNYNGTLRCSESKLPKKQYLAAEWEAGGRERKLHSTLKKVTNVIFQDFTTEFITEIKDVKIINTYKYN